MPKLPRVTAKVFASNAPEEKIGQFGSALTGTKITTANIEEIQALPAYEVGWSDAVISNRNYPTLEERNGLDKTLSQQIAYILQNGMSEWDSNTEYFTSQFCRINNNFYYSLIDNNIGNNPEISTDNWALWAPGVGVYANQDLSNLTATGQAILDSKLNQTQITNCILELPNRIKVEYTNGTITLKAGSTVIYPNGFDNSGNKKFEYYILPTDISISEAGSLSNDFLINLSTAKNTFNALQITAWYSGDTAPAVSGSAIWYDTLNNIIKWTGTSGSSWSGSSSFPILIAKRTSGTITGIKHVFNGIGFIGNTVFIDKGIKISIPNGRNIDGSLNNIVQTQESITTFSLANDNVEHHFYLTKAQSGIGYRSPNSTSLIFYQDKEPDTTYTYQYWLDTVNNYWKYTLDGGVNWDIYLLIGSLGKFKFSTNGIVEWDMPYLRAFEAVDNSSIKRTLSDNGLYVTRYNSGTSGYDEYFSDASKTNRVRIVQWGRTSASSGTVTLLKAHANVNYNIQITLCNKESATVNSGESAVGKATTTTFVYQLGDSNDILGAYWMTIGV